MAVGAESQVGEVEHRLRFGDGLQCVGVEGGRRLQVGLLDRHGMNLFGPQGRVIQKALAQMR